jgi:four helix bundle protein
VRSWDVDVRRAAATIVHARFPKANRLAKGHRLTLAVHAAVAAYPVRRHVGLANQTTRAAESIPANVAEGCGKSTDAELARFTDIALASAKELENHLMLAHDLRILDTSVFESLDAQLTEVRRMLFAFARAVRARTPKQVPQATRKP